MLFCSKQDRTNLLYFKLKILKLEDMIAMEYAKFIFKFNNHMLPDSFNCYFTNLENAHKFIKNSCFSFFFVIPNLIITDRV